MKAEVADVASIEILHVPDCPLAGQVRETAARALTRTDVEADVSTFPPRSRCWRR